MSGMTDPTFWMALETAKSAGNAKAKAREWKSYAEELEAEVEGLMRKLAIEQMHSAGLKAQLSAMQEKYPNSPLLQNSGQTYKSGNIKTVGRLVYEEAFDKKGRELGVTNPAQYRA